MPKHLKPLILGALLALLLLTISIQPAYAWTQLKTTFDSDGNPNCGRNSSLPCILWQEPPNTSITIYAYMDPSIQSTLWDDAIQLGFTSYNGVLAWNPYMQECLTVGCGPTTYLKGPIPCQFFARTNTDAFLSAPFYTGSYWKAYITGGTVTFNDQVSWNTQWMWVTFDENHGLCNGLKADIREVSAHETGHLQGLGHTKHSPALMETGPQNFWTVQSDDVAGLQYIYG
ncbi:MAG TPA: matrixin family metalloprotease [Ktedonobacterales bacterium]|jgi:hypothetical protein